MKILAVTAFLPYPVDSGGRRRLFSLYERLRRRFDLTLIFPVFAEQELEGVSRLRQIWPDVLLVPFYGIQAPYVGGGIRNRIWRFLHVLNPHSPPWFLKKQYGMAALIEGMLQSGEYALIHVELTQMLSYLPRNCPMPAVATEQDVSFIAWQRRFQIARGPKDKLTEFLLWQKVKRFELKYLKRFDRVIVVSEKDRENLMTILPGLEKKLVVIPNGVDLSFFAPPESTANPRFLLYSGGFGHYPNLDALGYFAETIRPALLELGLKLPLKLVGQVTKEQADLFASEAGIDFLSLERFVDDQEYLSLMHESVFIVPVRIGGGTRLKILEAMAAGCPVVSTSVGAEGIGAENGRHLLIANSPREFAEAVQRLVRDADLREALRHNARRLVEEKYSWDRIVKKQERLFINLVDSA